MRRQLIDADFPLAMVGTAIFGATDPVPLYVGGDLDAAETLFRLVTIGYDVSAIVATPGLSCEQLGIAVLGLFVSPQAELPLEIDGWTLDRAVNRS